MSLIENLHSIAIIWHPKNKHYEISKKGGIIRVQFNGRRRRTTTTTSLILGLLTKNVNAILNLESFDII